VDDVTAPGASPLDTWVAVQFVKNQFTPPDYLKYNGRIYAVPPEYMTAIGSGQDNPGVLVGVRGYLQDGGPTGKQWVMAPAFPPAILAAFDAIPGAHGWLSASAYTEYATLGLRLVETYHVDAADALAALQALYNAAVDNAETVAPGG
jgi:hypothetical protein